ncbi:MAG: hypothetical protein Q9195_005921 [Heterodermia aff. obscurata]
MSSCVAELDANLQSMLTLKAPGVTGSKIASITSLCVANIQSESVLIQKVYTHFKKAPGTHKLGVLYVVDSVTRQWLEHARKAGQTPGPTATDGTFAAGVNHVTELLPSIMTDIINNAPEAQKDKIKKLVDIWERGSTFPASMIANFKAKLSIPATDAIASNTPPGTPPTNVQQPKEQPAPAAAPAKDTSAILKALADMAKTNTAASGMASQASSSNVTNPQNAYPQNVPSSVNQAPSVPSNQPVGIPGASNSALQLAGISNTPSSTQNPPVSSNGQSVVQGAAAAPGLPDVQQQVALLQYFQSQGVPQDQLVTALTMVMANGGNLPPPPSNNYPAQQPGWQQSQGYGNEQSRDQNGYNDQYLRSPPDQSRKTRARSRSPRAWDNRRDASPPRRRRDSPVYGDYDAGREGRGSNGRGGRGRADGYRQRSPDRFRRSPSPRRQGNALPPPGPKLIEYDYTLGSDRIKEEALREIFARFGIVQTCIVNVDKRHAFVKMLTRVDAKRAKDGMETFKSTDMQLRTRWGVGFGPRDCSDYQTGISVIPIERLTEADRKWMLTADYGGTGGKPIEGGLVVEEPDIEIGAGVSSKAISRRMQTDKGGNAGPRSSRDGFGPGVGGPDRYRLPERNMRDNGPMGVPPAVPGFGFQFPPMPNGMPMFPPGFVMPPGANYGQPPPPGAL